jgi:hypothetical protein
MQAVLAAIQTTRPASAFAWPLPAAAGNIPVSFSMGVTPSGTATGVMTRIGDYISWPVVVQTAGNFTITTDAPNPATLQIRIDGVPVGAGTWTGALSLGLHGIMVRNLSAAGTTITKLMVTKAAATTSTK